MIEIDLAYRAYLAAIGVTTTIGSVIGLYLIGAVARPFIPDFEDTDNLTAARFGAGLYSIAFVFTASLVILAIFAAFSIVGETVMMVIP